MNVQAYGICLTVQTAVTARYAWHTVWHLSDGADSCHGKVCMAYGADSCHGKVCMARYAWHTVTCDGRRLIQCVTVLCAVREGARQAGRRTVTLSLTVCNKRLGHTHSIAPTVAMRTYQVAGRYAHTSSWQPLWQSLRKEKLRARATVESHSGECMRNRSPPSVCEHCELPSAVSRERTGWRNAVPVNRLPGFHTHTHTGAKCPSASALLWPSYRQLGHSYSHSQAPPA
jgi:hypothetical protein